MDNRADCCRCFFSLVDRALAGRAKEQGLYSATAQPFRVERNEQEASGGWRSPESLARGATLDPAQRALARPARIVKFCAEKGFRVDRPSWMALIVPTPRSRGARHKACATAAQPRTVLQYSTQNLFGHSALGETISAARAPHWP